MPFAETEKQALIYDILGRTTLEYDPQCKHDVNSAIHMLWTSSRQNLYKYDETATLVVIFAAEFFAFGSIFQIIAMVCYGSKRCRRPRFRKSTFAKYCCCCCLKGDCCYKVTKIAHGAIITTWSSLLMVFVATNFGRQKPKYNKLIDWRQYHLCVDEYMQVTKAQLDSVQYLHAASYINLAFSIFMVAVSVFSLTSFIIFAARQSRISRRQRSQQSFKKLRTQSNS